MKKKKVLSVVLAAAMMASMATGAQVVSADDKETITFWFPTFASSDGEYTDEEFWAEVLAPFEEENNCEVKVEIIPWDNYEEKYLTGTTSKDGPDVGYMYMEMFYDYIDNGVIADIDSYFTDEEKENYLYYDLGNLLGGQYALPVVVGNPRILIANMDILEQAGITSVPTTTEEFDAACAAIKENCPDVTPFLQDWGNAHYGSLNEIFWPFFWGAGGEIVDDEGNLTIDTEAGLEATEYIRGLLDNGYLPDTCTSCDDVIEPFKNGEVGMIYIASSNALRIEDINWDYTAVVQGSEEASTFVAADSLVMFNSCENKDLAAALMKYVTSADVMSQFHQNISDQPPITKDEDYTGDERYATLFTEYGDNFQSLPVFKGAASLYDTLYKNLQSMMLGEMDAQEVLTETTSYYNDNLK
jgi:multiple sugar transport system substrate-binding protein